MSPRSTEPEPDEAELNGLTPHALHSDTAPVRVATVASESGAASETADVFPERYEKGELLALGGMGEIRCVWDRVLGRQVAMKLLSWSLLDSERARARFLAETQLTAELDHPGIVAVYDAGELPSGRPWYTMRLLRGRTLERVIRDHHAGAPSSAMRLAEILAAFQRVCEAMAYAHARQVVHRDLKPQNVMVGRYGEILILDWGLAKRASASAEEPSVDGGQGRAADPESALTRFGEVLGTPAYMAPEQARGDLAMVGKPSDVYALGAMLYEIITGCPPFAGTTSGILRMTRAPSLPPLPDLPVELRPAVEGLLCLCTRCLGKDPGTRPAVDEVVEELRRWLERQRRAVEARRTVMQAAAYEPEMLELRERAARLRADARALLGSLRSYAPRSEKAPAWELEAHAEQLERQRAVTEVRWLQTLRAALSLDPECAEAHARLARHYALELREAELRRDANAGAASEALLREHDRGEHRELLDGQARLTLLTEPRGADVEAYRYVERERRLELVYVAHLGRSPLREVRLPSGSYVLVVSASGHIPVRYPVHLTRGGTWTGTPPGQPAPTPVYLPRVDELDPEHAAYVPAGWFVSGGDERAVEALPRRDVWVPGFVVQRFPVTHDQYLRFLNDCVQRNEVERALHAAPRLPRGSGGVEGLAAGEEPLAYERGADGCFRLAAPTAATAWERSGPVALIDWYGARDYAVWLASRTGKPWRLLNELEWEKAARGVDGRLLPWGDHLEPTRACMLGSHPDVPRPLDVHTFPEDESPYGVRGTAGNVRDWCENTWEWDGPALHDRQLVLAAADPHDRSLRAVRGGAWSAMPDFCRSAARFALAPDERLLAVGFRLGYSYPGDQ